MSSDRVTNDLSFGLKPGYAEMKSMHFQTDKGADRQANMIALRDFEGKLPAVGRTVRKMSHAKNLEISED